MSNISSLDFEISVKKLLEAKKSCDDSSSDSSSSLSGESVLFLEDYDEEVDNCFIKDKFNLYLENLFKDLALRSSLPKF